MFTRTALFAFALVLSSAGCAGADEDPPGGKSSPATAECPDPSAGDVHYLAGSNEDAEVCTRITFACADGQTSFNDGCGCGCLGEGAPDPTCPDPSDPSVHYVGDSHENPSACTAMLIGCEPRQTPFSNECGCGCIDETLPEPACPDPNDPRVHYVAGSDQLPGVCLALMFACDERQTLFSDECGCGCIDEVENPPGPEGDFCGGIGGIPCADGFACVLDGDYPDAAGYCTASPEGQFCGGIGGLSCPDGFTCVLDGDYPDAGGHCTASPEPQVCGGIAGIPCADGFVCVYPNVYNDDSFGTCVSEAEVPFCGGIGNIPCPEFLHCVLDSDDPDAGGHCEAN